MKAFIILALVLLALFYAQRSWMPRHEPEVVQKRSGAVTAAGGGAREWQQAPNTVMDMQDAMGSASGGAAHAARDAVTQQLGR
jgi:hypothetical protein